MDLYHLYADLEIPALKLLDIKEALENNIDEIDREIAKLHNAKIKIKTQIKSIDKFVDLMFRSINHTYLCKGDQIKKEQTEDDFTDNEIEQYVDLISDFVKDVRKALK